MRDRCDLDLEIPTGAFDVLVGLSWQLPDVAPVVLCVGERRCGGEVHRGLAVGYHTPARTTWEQYLVVRAGPWEFYPEVKFLRRCVNCPGVRVEAGQLRRAHKGLANAREEEEAMQALSSPVVNPVGVRFGPLNVHFQFCEVDVRVKGVWE